MSIHRRAHPHRHHRAYHALQILRDVVSQPNARRFRPSGFRFIHQRGVLRHEQSARLERASRLLVVRVLPLLSRRHARRITPSQPFLVSRRHQRHRAVRLRSRTVSDEAPSAARDERGEERRRRHRARGARRGTAVGRRRALYAPASVRFANRALHGDDRVCGVARARFEF